MRKVVAMLSLVAAAGVVRADLRSDINAAYRKVDVAMKAKDVKKVEAAMKEVVAPDFKYVEGGVTQDFKTFIGNLNASVAMMEKVTVSTSRVLRVKQDGDRATGSVEHVMKGTMKMPDKKVHTTSWTGVFTEEYRKVGGKWKTSKIVPTSQKFLVDGKPAKM